MGSFDAVALGAVFTIIGSLVLLVAVMGIVAFKMRKKASQSRKSPSNDS